MIVDIALQIRSVDCVFKRQASGNRSFDFDGGLRNRWPALRTENDPFPEDFPGVDVYHAHHTLVLGTWL